MASTVPISRLVPLNGTEQIHQAQEHATACCLSIAWPTTHTLSTNIIDVSACRSHIPDAPRQPSWDCLQREMRGMRVSTR